MQTDRFQGKVSKKLDWNQAIATVGDTISNVFSKPDTYNITNITDDKKDDDNTMLYVGIGGGVLVLILLIVLLK